MAETVDKIRENRLRRVAARRGKMLVKSRRRDPEALDYGLYVLVEDCKGNRVGPHGGGEAMALFRNGWGTDLDGIERELDSGRSLGEEAAALAF